MYYKILTATLFMAMTACQPHSTPEYALTTEHSRIESVEPSAQTTPTIADDANDPAIWINATDPAKSLILGSGGEGGLEVYDLDGSRIGQVEGGAISLVDVRSNFSLAGETVGLVVAFDVAGSKILIYSLNAQERSLINLSGASIATQAELEGLCLYQSPLSGKSYVFSTGEGLIEQWELFDSMGKLSTRHVRTIPVGYGAGHCVGHDNGSTIYLAHETIGVFKLNA